MAEGKAHRLLLPQLKAAAEMECQKDWQQETEFLLRSSNLIYTRGA